MPLWTILTSLGIAHQQDPLIMDKASNKFDLLINQTQLKPDFYKAEYFACNDLFQPSNYLVEKRRRSKVGNHLPLKRNCAYEQKRIFVRGIFRSLTIIEFLNVTPFVALRTRMSTNIT